MNPFFFGSSEAPLLGVHHPPRGRAPRERGVLLCPPFGQEAMRSHRAFRQLAMLLARRGFHVLRFDPSGTGDSAGEGESASLRRWQQDVATAIQELEDMGGVSRVSLVGLRLGAALAARAASGRDDLCDLVLWDPVVSGAAYLEELRAAQIRHGGPDPGALDRLDPDACAGILGFPVSGALAREVADVDLPKLDWHGWRRMLAVSADAAGNAATLTESFASAPCPAELRALPAAGSWAEVDNFGSAWIPQQVIQAIVAFLDEEPLS